MSKPTWVDPPEGWKYGFPKVWNGEGDANSWMIQEGYPEQLIKRYGEYFHVRCWNVEEG